MSKDNFQYKSIFDSLSYTIMLLTSSVVGFSVSYQVIRSTKKFGLSEFFFSCCYDFWSIKQPTVF